MLKKAFSVWVLMILLMVALPSVVAYYSVRSRPLGGYSVNVPTSQSETQTAINFSIAVLPDTQFYSANYPDIFDNQTQWIADNAQSMNIVFVTHEGDIVNDYSSLSEWNNANHSISRLDVGNVSYGVLPGNHDGSPGNVANYNIYFNYSRFNGKSWYGGAYQNDNSNNFELFHGGQDDYLIFHFQYQPSDQVLAWANSTLQNFPNTRVIVTTHSYLNVDGTRTDIGQRIWDSLIAPHADRIFLVLCGHNHAEAERQDTVNGHTVYQLLADYQDRVNGGNGWLRMLQFCPGNDKICVRTYSPYLDSYENDSDSQFTLSYDMTGAKVFVVPDDYSSIQEAINAASDGDTVFVKNGKYYENILVNKTLNLRGEDKNSTIVDGNDTGNVVTLVSNNANVNGFTFQNSAGALYSCIRLDQVSGCSIFSNIADNSNSNASGNGIFLQSSERNNISGNLVINTWDGITFWGSSGNTISRNTVVNLFNVGGTSIQFVYGSAFNQAIGNTLLGIAQIGIRCYQADSGSNVLIGNIVENHHFGIYADGSSNNIFYHNSIINDTINQAYITGVNVWDNGYPSGGNYWSDYNGIDSNHDGIGDTGYAIDANNIDHFPLMSPWAPPEIAVANLSTSKTILGQGFPLNFSATIQNFGNKIETFTVDVYANSSLLTSANYTFTSGNLTLSAIWNSSGFAKGNYSLTMSVEPLLDEVDITNNNMTAQVFITIPGDIKGDKTVNILDAILLAGCYSSTPASPHWNPNTDINNDGIVNILDAIILSGNYGKSWT